MSRYFRFGLTLLGLSLTILGETSFALSVEDTQEFRRTQSKVVITVNVSKQCSIPNFISDMNYKQVYATCDLDLQEWNKKGYEYLPQQGGSYAYPNEMWTNSWEGNKDTPQITVWVKGVNSFDEGKMRINEAIASGQLKVDITLFNKGGQFTPVK